jgi:C-terminal processing protease CtpA/Prc
LTSPGDVYTPLVKFTSNKEANKLGNAYGNILLHSNLIVKPVAILNNARCYSACDLFSVIMKQSNIPIFSHDRLSGAGGANVVELKSYLAPKLPSVFNAGLPALQDMRVGWRQFVTDDGRLIEDTGVVSDLLVPPVVEDFMPGTKVFSYFESIAAHLYDGTSEKDQVFCKCLILII